MHTVDRLIRSFAPDHYQLSLTLDRPGRSFSGLVTIHGVSSGAEIRLHAKELSVDSVTLDGKAAACTPIDDVLVITQPDLQPGKHIVVIAYTGRITDPMHGIYPCYYTHNGAKKELLATQFESHHAREVFPCVDEPEAKATFDVTITTEKGITVLGNMPVKQQTVEDDRLVTTFATTPRMSTYLLAWVVGDLHRKTATTKSGIEVNVWATPAQQPDSLDFALDMATRTIEFFNDYFGIPYPLPKSDHVALPDFSAGAMENWGLVTYREIALLADPSSASISSKQYVALVVAHELSHQWFGNLVTMRWWNNLWLNESFATLMEYVAVNALYPDWNMWLEFSSSETILALQRDSLDGVQAVQTDVHHPDEISTLFDGAIVYAKGARLLRMLQQYVGNEAFQAGLKRYFETHAYQNTESDDLWQAIAHASGQDIAAFMNKWISQPGYPVVDITTENDTVYIKQQQFFIGAHEPSERLWPIPLNSTSDSLPELFDQPEAHVSLTKPISSSLLRLNVGDSAHFLTNYSPSLLNEILAGLGTLTPLDRLQLLHEQTLLARGGMVASASLVPLLQRYAHETHYIVWEIIALALGGLRKFVEDDVESEAHLRRLYVALAHRQHERLGWHSVNNEPETESKLRAIVVAMILYGEDQNSIHTALELYRTTKIEDLDPELRPLIIGAVVRHGGNPAIITELMNRYKDLANAEIKQDIAAGLASSHNTQELKALLAYCQDSSIVRAQDVRHWFASIIQNRYGRDAAWHWLKQSWPWIVQTFGSDFSYDDFARYAGAALLTRAQLEEYQAFFSPYKDEPALARVIAIGSKEIEARVTLVERDASAVRAALAKL